MRHARAADPRPSLGPSPAVRRGLACVLAIAALAASGCRQADRGPIGIGVVVGGDGVLGARLAAEEVQAGGGIDGRALELVVIPHALATAAEPSVLAAERLADDERVVAVVGHSNSAASLAASQVYNARELVHIAPTSTAPLFSDAGPYSFRLVPDDRRQAEFLVRQVAAEGARRVALVYVNDDYGRALAAAVRERLAQGGASPIYETPYLENADSVQLAASASAVVAARPDLLLWLGRGPELATFLIPLRRHGAQPRIYASDGVDASLAYAAPRRLEGVRFVRFVDPAGTDARLQRFRARMRAVHGREATTDAVTAYDATMLLVAALRSGARTRQEVREWLATVGQESEAYAGLSGPIAFDANGDVVRPHLLAEVRADGVHAVPAR